MMKRIWYIPFELSTNSKIQVAEKIIWSKRKEYSTKQRP